MARNMYTIHSVTLAQKLIWNFSLQHDLVLWIVDFLTNKCQQVFVNMSSARAVTYTGSPQGCVLSPLLYILYTDDCHSNRENSYLIKFADDSALLSLLLGTRDGHHVALDDFTEWCDEPYLDLNVNKTKEVIVDFRRYTYGAIQIRGETVEIVHSYKYLGMIMWTLAIPPTSTHIHSLLLVKTLLLLICRCCFLIVPTHHQ